MRYYRDSKGRFCSREKMRVILKEAIFNPSLSIFHSLVEHTGSYQLANRFNIVRAYPHLLRRFRNEYKIYECF
jgi:hypothetical protein